MWEPPAPGEHFDEDHRYVLRLHPKEKPAQDTIRERSVNLKKATQDLRESLRNTTEMLMQAGESGHAEPVQAAAATTGASSSSAAPPADPQPDVSMPPRQLEPAGHFVLSPICKYDIGEEKNEPFNFSPQMISDWWSDPAEFQIWKQTFVRQD